MKLLVSVEISHDRLGIPHLLLALPQALDSVRVSTSAGIQATGPDGMTIQPSGLDALVKVHFNVAYAETAARLPIAATAAARPTSAAIDAALDPEPFEQPDMAGE